ncbi:MAG: hypothetical protein MUC59_01735 [Saprospiraceae bacterium]|jgi:uncharacterized membrane protein|nr:hypothetical protein [Saprospiraceae bacterium]
MRFFFCFSMALLLGCSTGGTVEVAGVKVGASLRAFADGQGFDYTGHLDKAIKGDEAALQELLKFNPSQDSAAAVGHGQVMKALLGKLGDELFSQKINPLTESQKRQLWAGLELAGATSLKNESPTTMKALLPNDTPTAHRGLYVFNDDQSSFRDCAQPDARYLVVDETGGNLEINYRKLVKFPYPNQPVYLAVKGFKAPYFGSKSLSDGFDAFFIVTEVEKMEAKNFRNTCITYDFWALGTEPFWQAQVSAAEGIIEYRGMDDDRTKVFAYQPPVEEKGVKIYAGVNQESGDNIRIEVEDRPCGDGMSDRAYQLSLKLTINGKDLSGCGIPFEEVAQDSSEMEGN